MVAALRSEQVVQTGARAVRALIVQVLVTPTWVGLQLYDAFFYSCTSRVYADTGRGSLGGRHDGEAGRVDCGRILRVAMVQFASSIIRE